MSRGRVGGKNMLGAKDGVGERDEQITGDRWKVRARGSAGE